MTRKCDGEKRNNLKTALKRVIFDCGGLEAASTLTRVGPSHLSDCGNVMNDKMVPVDVVLDLELFTGRPHVTTTLAALQGYGLVMTEAKRPKSDLAVLAARIGQDSSRLLGDAATALAHKGLTPRERIKITRDLAELIDVALELREWLAADAAHAEECAA